MLSFIYKNADAIIPTPAEFTEEDKALLAMPKEMLPVLRGHIDHFHLHRYAESVWQIIAEGNRYVDAQKPWSLKKEDPTRMATVLYTLADVIRQIAMLTQPILPVASSKILTILSVEKSDFTQLEVALKPGLSVSEPQPLFAKYI